MLFGVEGNQFLFHRNFSSFILVNTVLGKTGVRILSLELSIKGSLWLGEFYKEDIKDRPLSQVKYATYP